MEALRPPSPKLWIVGPTHDLALFVTTPLIIVPIIALLRLQFSVAEISLYVAAFGATGHHLPGLLRAYGDRELFARFRLRFLIAPVLLTVCCVGLANTDLRALSVIVLVWGTWHGLAQVFGVLRIYDAKVGSHAPRTVALDRWMCIAFFVAGLLYSPGRTTSLLETAFAAGVPLIFAEVLHVVRDVWGIGTAVLSVAFLANYFDMRRRGSPASPVKLVCMVTSFGFWWYAMVWIDNAILGIALFEIFHDVQYLAVAWVFNRNRIDKGHAMGSFTRFLFRPSGLMIALYVTLAVLYGYAIHVPNLIEATVVKDSLLGLVATSALLHFYFDGFIWKIRERSTRESLGLSGGGEDRAGHLHEGIWHGLKWSLFVVPLAALIAFQLGGVPPQVEQRRRIVEVAPSANSYALLASALLDAGRAEEAVAELRLALDLEPASALAHHKLGLALHRLGRFEEAVAEHRLALRASPRRANRLVALAASLSGAGQDEEAIATYREALHLAPEHRGVHEPLASLLSGAGRNDEALPHLEQAVVQRPGSWEAEFNLAVSQSALGRLGEAVTHYRRAVSLNKDSWRAHRALGLALRQLGRHPQAQQHLRRSQTLRRAAGG